MVVTSQPPCSLKRLKPFYIPSTCLNKTLSHKNADNVSHFQSWVHYTEQLLQSLLAISYLYNTLSTVLIFVITVLTKHYLFHFISLN